MTAEERSRLAMEIQSMIKKQVQLVMDAARANAPRGVAVTVELSLNIEVASSTEEEK